MSVPVSSLTSLGSAASCCVFLSRNLECFMCRRNDQFLEVVRKRKKEKRISPYLFRLSNLPRPPDRHHRALLALLGPPRPSLALDSGRRAWPSHSTCNSSPHTVGPPKTFLSDIIFAWAVYYFPFLRHSALHSASLWLCRLFVNI